MAVLTEKGEELLLMLKKLETRDEYVATILSLTVGQENPDENYQILIDYLLKNPNPTYEEITGEVFKIKGLEMYLDDDDE